MKTRTLLLLAVGCGLAIMLAGAVFLFQLAGQDDVVEPIALGEPVGIGDMTVVIERATEASGELAVTVEIGGVEDDDPAADFRLIASGRPLTVADSTCAATDSSPQTCVVTFDVSTADGSSRVLFYERGDERARWVLG